jgi:phosphoglycolate phosphatase-like HAD superfamily hydrolase
MLVASGTFFFDLDGTLVDTTYLHTVAWWRAFTDSGEPVPMARIHPLIGMGGSELLNELLGRDDPVIEKAHGRHFASLHRFITAVPGGTEIIRYIKGQGGRVVIVTSAGQADLPPLLGPLGGADVMSDIVHGEMTDRAKPAPDLFLLALGRAGIPPSEGLAVGDSLWDIKAAGHAGLSCVGVESGGTEARALQEAGAVAVYQSCAEVLDCMAAPPMAGLSKKTRDQRYERGESK